MGLGGCISQSVMKMNWCKSLVEDSIFTTETRRDCRNYAMAMTVGGKRVMDVFSCLSRRGRGRNERDRAQLPPVLPVPLDAEAHPRQAVFYSNGPVRVSPGRHRSGQQEPPDPVLSGHL